MRVRLEGLPDRYLEDHIAAKGKNSLSHKICVYKFIPMPQALKNTGCTGCSGKRTGKIGKDTGMAPDESEKQKRGDRWSKELRQKKFILRHWWISLISRILSWTLNFKNTKAQSYSEVTLWKMIQDHTQYLLNKSHQHHRWQPQKSWTLYQDYQDAQDKQQTQYPLAPRSKWKMHQRFLKKTKVQLPRYVYQMAPIMVQYGRPSRSSWAKSVRSFFGRTIMGKSIWENPFCSTVGRKFPIGSVFR